MRVLALEPWLGGSHERFLAQWRARSAHEVEVVGLPARHWKWRMASGGWRLAEKVRQEGVARPEALLVSSLCDLTQLYGSLPASWGDVPALLYFHENQLTFPLRAGQQRDHTHGWQNLLSCTRAARVAFNSGYHRDAVREASEALLARLPSPKPTGAVCDALAAADVVWPGVDLEEVPLGAGAPRGGPLRVGFNHRVEHDKDPLAFLDACVAARRRGAALEVVLLGARFEKAPDGLRERLDLLGDAVLFADFDPDRASYAARLGACDVVVSTAIHEFYGMAMLEALAAGCAVLAPDRLAYPETLPSGLPGVHRHQDDDLAERLIHLAGEPAALRAPDSRQRRRRAAAPHDASVTAARLDELVEALRHPRRDT